MNKILKIQSSIHGDFSHCKFRFRSKIRKIRTEMRKEYLWNQELHLGSNPLSLWFQQQITSLFLCFVPPSCCKHNPGTQNSCSPLLSKTALENSHVWLWNQLSRSLPWLLQKLSREGEKKKGTLLPVLSWFSSGSPLWFRAPFGMYIQHTPTPDNLHTQSMLRQQ